jgi:site-specific recombinase XerD
MTSKRSGKSSDQVTEARAAAQRSKLEAQAEAREASEKQAAAQAETSSRNMKSKKDQQQLLAKRRATITIERTLADYLADHEGGNHSPKTLEWHRTALGLLKDFLQEERGITLVGEIDAPDLNAWFVHLRKTPGGHGKPRSERTVQTYARSARAFFHWLVRQEIIDRNPFDSVTFPKVGKPLIRTIEPEEFEQLLLACAPPHETGPPGERVAVCNRAILWLLYNRGIRVSELVNLHVDDLERKKEVIMMLGKSSK